MHAAQQFACTSLNRHPSYTMQAELLRVPPQGNFKYAQKEHYGSGAGCTCTHTAMQRYAKHSAMRLPDRPCQPAVVAAAAAAAAHNSLVMMFLMVSAGSSPSVLKAGFSLSMPMKISVGRPWICSGQAAQHNRANGRAWQRLHTKSNLYTCMSRSGVLHCSCQCITGAGHSIAPASEL